MERVCNVCGSVLSDGVSFCPNCGTPVPEEPAAEQVEQMASEAQTVEEPAAEQAVTEVQPVTEQAEQVVTEVQPIAEQVERTAAEVQPMMQNSTFGAAVDGGMQNGTFGAAVDNGMQNTYYDASMNYGAQNTYYAAPTGMGTIPEKKDPKGLGIAALILGIIGLLTSCCGGGLLFGLIALILGIIYAIKAKKKGLGIAGIILGAISLLISGILLIMVIAAPAGFISALDDMGIDTGDFEKYIDDPSSVDDPYSINNIINNIENDTTEDWFSTDDWKSTEEWVATDEWAATENQQDWNDYSSTTSITDMGQMRIGDRVYTFPCRVGDGLYVITDGSDTQYAASDAVAEIIDSGLTPGDYAMVKMYDDNYNYFYGFIQNMTDYTIYDVNELMITGIDADNYSFDSVPDVEVYGGISIYMNQSAVEILLGSPDYTEDDGTKWVYKKYDNSVGLYIWFDNDMVDEVQVAYFTEDER
ncbi:MAG: zinc-ribbon domain-containing protein [Lachnospiraceae bacterium]|nr:zinc-ribbon domain-containing protein [Lachnospiraceae bacterium]